MDTEQVLGSAKMKNKLDPAMDTEHILGSAKTKNRLDPATDIEQILGSAKMKTDWIQQQPTYPKWMYTYKGISQPNLGSKQV